MSTTSTPGILVLPDHPGSSGPAAAIGGRVLRHASGAPWIAGDWRDEDLTFVTAGTSRLALLGRTAAVPEALTRRLGAARSIADLGTATPGAGHLVASIDGQVRVQGTLSTAHRVFRARVDGLTIAADRPEALAALTGAGVVEESLALHLLAPYGPPWPLSDDVVWRSVEAVPADHYLRLRSDGTDLLVRRWTPPEPDIPLPAASAVLREVLSAALEARWAPGRVLSADLSGGLDSTGLCFLAASLGIPLTTLHLESGDPQNADQAWADRCLPLLPAAEHLRVPAAELPGPYRAPGDGHPADLEAPTAFMRAAVVDHLAGLVAAHGSTTHLQGIGADELFLPRAAWLPALVRRHPAHALGHVRRMRSRSRWTWPATLRVLLGSRSFPRWLADSADLITAPRDGRGSDTGWEIAARMPVWATPEAVDAVRRLLTRAAAAGPAPLSAVAAHHQLLRLIQVDGTFVRHASRIGARHGVSFQAPYLDDAVVDAALSVRLPDRVADGRVKPVLSHVLRGIAPDALLSRTGKGDASTDLYAGLRRDRDHLLELFADSRLADLGLIDRDALRRVVLGLHVDARPLMPLDRTAATEMWLRSLPDRAAPDRTRTTSRGV